MLLFTRFAHSKLHDRQKIQETSAAGDNASDQPKPKDRNTEEVEAESISYAVCQYFGIQTGENSFGYIASWSKDKDLKELRASLETINKTSCELINDIERNYKEICKERGIDLNAQKKETVPVVLPPAREQAESFAREYVLYAQAIRVETLSETKIQAQITQYTDKILHHDIADMVLFLEEQKQAKWNGTKKWRWLGQWRCPGCR